MPESLKIAKSRLTVSVRSESAEKYRDTVRVLVGPDQVEFQIFRYLLTASSHFFEAALTGDFKEAREGIVRLPEVKPEIFELYVARLVGGDLQLAEGNDVECATHRARMDSLKAEVDRQRQQADYARALPKPEPETRPCRHPSLQDLIAAYALGDMLRSPDFKNDALVEAYSLMICHDFQPSIEMTRLAYVNTTKGSKLRSLFAFIHAIRGNASQFASSHGWPREHPAEVITQLMKHRRAWVPEAYRPQLDSSCEQFFE